MDSERKVAVLFDAENIASKYTPVILNEANALGSVIIRRIYGDWTAREMSSWKQVILDHSIQPIQQYRNVSGKNSSDSALIIDAMDLLYQGRVDAFCIVSSDSDFTRLAARLRESEKFVLGLGEQKTPQSFISACSKFAYLDLLYEAAQPEKSEKTAAFLAQETEKIVAEYEKQGIHPYNVPVGGSSLVGAAGYINAIPEIMKQMKEQGIEAKYLVCGYGSMGTFGGLLAGAKYFKAPFEVIGIPVSPAYRSPEQVAEFIDKLSAEYELGIHVTPEEVRIETGTPEEPYYGIAYNVPDPVTQQYMALLARTEGLFTDPCYTGKIFHGFVDLVRSGKIPEGENAIFLHSGGTPAIWSKEHLDAAQEIFYDGEGLFVHKA